MNEASETYHNVKKWYEQMPKRENILILRNEKATLR